MNDKYACELHVKRIGMKSLGKCVVWCVIVRIYVSVYVVFTGLTLKHNMNMNNVLWLVCYMNDIGWHLYGIEHDVWSQTV